MLKHSIIIASVAIVSVLAVGVAGSVGLAIIAWLRA